MRKKKYRWHYLVNVGIHGVNHLGSTDFGKAWVDTFYEFSESKYKEFLAEQRELSAEKIINNILTEEERKGKPKVKPVVTPEFGGVAMVTQYRQKSHEFKTCIFHADFQWTREDLEMYLKTQSPTELKRILEDASIYHKPREI
jgi:hypothetical protein